jgi:SAM-dependent methyltransferase
MDRTTRILQHLKQDGRGLEIGPSHAPVAPRAKGFNVKILDHLPAEGLREKYRPLVPDVSAIEEVDYVWNGEPFADLVGPGTRFDWIIASHVIEHSTCLISFLNDCASILAEGGVIALVVPDKRYCFDAFREKTGLGKVIDVYAGRPSRHSAGTAAEFYLNIATKKGAITWHAMAAPGGMTLLHGLDDARRAINEIERNNAFIDLHNWVFTPTSFRLIVEDLYQLGYTTLREAALAPTLGHEFFVWLSREGRGPQIDRPLMLEMNGREV